MASWQLDRANRVEVARLARNIHTEPAMAEFRAKQHAEAIGKRLFFDRRGPVELYPARNYDNYNKPRTSCSEVADDPDDPAMLVAELETTLAGCRWLRGRWDELREIIDMGLGWQSQEKLKAVRLLGRQPLQAVSVREVAEVFLACHVVEPQFSYAFQELRCEIDEDLFKRYKHRLSRRNLEAITPADATAARAVLLGIVEKATERLRVLEARHQKVADAVGALQNDVLSFDDGKSGEQIRRHQASCNRLLLRNLDAIHKGRRNEASGWGRTKQQREERKQDGNHRRPGDERLVVDPHGTVRNADGYEGNLEEGLARFAAQFGRQFVGMDEAPGGIEANAIPAVPDFARWCPPTMPDLEGGAEAACGRGDGGVRDPRRTEEGDGGADGTVRGEETCGRGDGGVRDPRRTEEGDGGEPSGARDARRTENVLVTLVVTEKGEGANIQNETGDDERSGAEGLTGTAGGAGGAELPVSGGGKHHEDDASKVTFCENVSIGGTRGVERSVDRVAAKDLEAPLSRREKKRRRRAMEKTELDRRRGSTQKGKGATVTEMIDSIQVIFPRVADVLRDHLPRSP